MDVDQRQSASTKGSVSAVANPRGSDGKELAWAFIGLLLWSAVVLGGVCGVGYVLGHALFHWW
jgi:hypothetical protein